MSGQLTRLNFYSLTDDKVELYTNQILVPPTNFVKFSLSYTEHGPPVPALAVLVNPGSGFPLAYFGGWLGLDPDTTYWFRAWIEDPLGNVLGEAARWLSTFSEGSVQDTGPVFNSCGDVIEENEDRVEWGRTFASGPAKSPTVKGTEIA